MKPDILRIDPTFWKIATPDQKFLNSSKQLPPLIAFQKCVEIAPDFARAYEGAGMVQLGKRKGMIATIREHLESVEQSSKIGPRISR